MRTKILALITGIGLLLAAVPVWAHHAFAAEFDANKPITFKGTVSYIVGRDRVAIIDPGPLDKPNSSLLCRRRGCFPGLYFAGCA